MKLCISVEKRCIVLWMYPRYYGGAVHVLLVASFSPWRPGFDPRPVYVCFTIDKVVLGQVFLGLLRISPDIIPPLLHFHLPCKVKIKGKVIFLLLSTNAQLLSQVYITIVSIKMLFSCVYSNICSTLTFYVTEQDADVELPDDDMEMLKHVGVWIM